jgi:HD-GYP domain-containing protein (c-di-GMP phosphodiesterase class II)
MRLVHVDELKGNEILAVPILSRNEIVLIQSDTVLKEEYIKRLKEFHLFSVYVKEPGDLSSNTSETVQAIYVDDIESTSHISHEPSVKVPHYKADDTIKDSKEVVTKVMDRYIYKKSKNLKIIGNAAQKILDAVLTEPEIVNSITEIRNISNDLYTHCVNVCALSTIMALKMKMNHKQAKSVAMGAILHDIGLKYVQVPYIDVSLKDLSNEDQLKYKKHTIFGYSSIQEEQWLSETAKEIILLHHEYMDGSGYPFMQTGAKLKTEVKLVTICDDFDALISGIGAKKMKIYEAIEYIRVHAGKLYDSEIVKKVLDSVAAYPTGMQVVTNEGEIGVVIGQNKDATDRPIIKMLKHQDGSDYEEDVKKDLMEILTLFIVDTL